MALEAASGRLRIGVRRRGALMRLAWAWATFAGLGACGDGGGTANLGSQAWGSIQVAVETRPSPPRHGHNEVVVLVSSERHRPVYDAVVHLRAQQNAWVQAIEDGHVGVYRRAVDFGEGDHVTLQVQVQRGTQETILDFPVPIGTTK